MFLNNRNFSSDAMDLFASFGSRGLALLESSESSDNLTQQSGSSVEKGLADTSRIYAKFQKVVCGRDLNPEQAAASLFAGGSQTQ